MSRRGVDQNDLTLKPGQFQAGNAKGIGLQKIGGAKSELDRYRDALAKMEAQWEHATKQLNENVMHQQIEHLNV